MSYWKTNWERAKAEAGEERLVMIRDGGHYVLFGDDAEEASWVLGTCLTERRECFVPAGAVDEAIGKLLRAGKKVVLADVIEPRRKKGA